MFCWCSHQPDASVCAGCSTQQRVSWSQTIPRSSPFTLGRENSVRSATSSLLAGSRWKMNSPPRAPVFSAVIASRNSTTRPRGGKCVVSRPTLTILPCYFDIITSVSYRKFCDSVVSENFEIACPTAIPACRIWQGKHRCFSQTTKT